MSNPAGITHPSDRLATRKDRLEDLSRRVRRLRRFVLLIVALEAGAVLALLLGVPLLT